MFKTVRVGDTSLQYAIVSQNDEFSGGPCAVTAAPHRAKTKRKTRYHKTVILILITLIVGCCVVIAAVLVPILVASKLVGNLPESAKFQTFAIAASSIQGYNKYDHNGRRYVELLPIKEPPVDAVIQFQDDVPLVRNSPSLPSLPSESLAPSTSFSVDSQRLHLQRSAAFGSPRVSTVPTSVSQVTSFSKNLTKNVIADQQGIQLSSSAWNSSSYLLEQTTTFMVSQFYVLI